MQYGPGSCGLQYHFTVNNKEVIEKQVFASSSSRNSVTALSPESASVSFFGRCAFYSIFSLKLPRKVFKVILFEERDVSKCCLTLNMQHVITIILLCSIESFYYSFTW